MVGNSGRWLCALAVAIAASVTAIGDANAAPQGKQLVVLGDSFSANAWDSTSEEVACIRRATSWPSQLSTLMRVAGTEDVLDVSCTGASIDTGAGYTLGIEAKLADQAGAFGPRTEVVTMQFGLNDTWGAGDTTLWKAMDRCIFDLLRGCGLDAMDQGRIPDHRAVTGADYAARIRNAVTYIKYYAPNARIVLVGYPELFPSGTDTVCLSILGVAPFIQPRGRALVELLDAIDRAQREAAALLGVEFLDSRALTAGHGLCSADPWMNGLGDWRADIDGLPFHPSVDGDAVVARALYDRYARR
ncbi:SGNH/GDSL hydrolase family protein [Nocardia huaxiensis]|uniref:SGNH/GDSL hydrolase family protein n=1 Tax=Nocardia huaxiensis TaxID=2755382 RepID=A0A7D6VFS0_9NOCA|nr:SGNH/GDSL hydrolase family protein [Nocardia huaxiensis]QLY33422.1 SGNH/GDSL hydrolase family protein [Nocardia huaxiensis]